MVKKKNTEPAEREVRVVGKIIEAGRDLKVLPLT